MTFQPEKRSQTKIDVITPCATRTHLRSFDQAKLFDATMIVLNRPRVACPFDSFEVAHLNFSGRPPFNVAICGNYLEHTNQAIPFEPDYATIVTNLDGADRTQAPSVRIDLAVRFQTSQPQPVKRANQLQVRKSRIPTVKDHASGLKATLLCLFEHCREVVILGQRVLLLVKDAVVTRHMTVAISPQKRNQVDARDHSMMFARPVARNQLHLPSIRLVQSRVVYDKDTLVQADLALGFRPQRRSVRLKPMQKACESIMGWGFLLFALHASRFCGAHRARRGDQKVDVVFVRAFRRIHSAFLAHCSSTA